MGKRDGNFIMILDIDKIFTSDEVAQVQGACADTGPVIDMGPVSGN